MSIDEKLKELRAKGIETALVQCPGCSKNLIVMKSEQLLGITWIEKSVKQPPGDEWAEYIKK